jgi:hypothetical protein
MSPVVPHSSSLSFLPWFRKGPVAKYTVRGSPSEVRHEISGTGRRRCQLPRCNGEFYKRCGYYTSSGQRTAAMDMCKDRELVK